MLERYKDIIKKVLITIGILLIYRIAMLVTLPGVTLDLYKSITQEGSFLKTLNFFYGGGIDKCSIFALSIMPYMSASILVQFLTSDSGLEYFQKIKKDKEMGSVKLNSWTKYFTVIIAFSNALMMVSHIFHSYQDGNSIVYMAKPYFYPLSMVILVAGSMLVVWMANQISKYGIGNGVSVIIFFNVLSQTGDSLGQIINMVYKGKISHIVLFYIVTFFLAITFLVILVESSYKCIKVYFPSMEGSTSIEQKFPIKINNAGIMPSVLASSFVQFPTIIFSFIKDIFYIDSLQTLVRYCSKGGPLYYIIFSILLFVMTIVHSSISFDTNEIADQLEEHNIFIAGIPQGLATVNYLNSIVNKMNILAAIYLVIVCVLSEWICEQINMMIGGNLLNFTGTTIIVTVQVAKLILKGVSNYNYKKLIDSIKLKHI